MIFVHDDGEVEVLFKAWSVRTYNIVKRYGLKADTAEACIASADRVIEGKVRNAGLKTAIELYRGGGLGVYAITDRIHGKRTAGEVRNFCNYLDHSLHEKI